MGDLKRNQRRDGDAICEQVVAGGHEAGEIFTAIFGEGGAVYPGKHDLPHPRIAVAAVGHIAIREPGSVLMRDIGRRLIGVEAGSVAEYLVVYLAARITKADA